MLLQRLKLAAAESTASSGKPTELSTTGDTQETIASMDGALNELEEAQRLINNAQSKVSVCLTVVIAVNA